MTSSLCTELPHWPNHRFEVSAEKLRFSVPRPASPPGGPQAERSASQTELAWFVQIKLKEVNA
jgi:hypothetical protein